MNGAFCFPSAWVHLAAMSRSASLIPVALLGLFHYQKLLWEWASFTLKQLKIPKLLTFLRSDISYSQGRFTQITGALSESSLTLKWLQILGIVWVPCRAGTAVTLEGLRCFRRSLYVNTVTGWMKSQQCNSSALGSWSLPCLLRWYETLQLPLMNP